MYVEILSAVALAFGVAGTILIVFRLFGRKPPKFLIPAAAGIAMLVFTAWSDSTWYERTSQLVEAKGLTIIKALEGQSLLSPWSLVKPRVDQFVAINTAEIQTNDKHPNVFLFKTYFMKRHEQTLEVTVMVDCNTGKRFDIAPNTTFGEDGMPVGGEWLRLDKSDTLLKTICSGA